MSLDRFLAAALPAVAKPAQYIGGEWNAVRGDPRDARASMLLCFPDLYEIGMSCLAIRLLYHLINEQPGGFADLAFAPDLDMEAALRAARLPLFGLQSRRPAREFDVVGITLQNETLSTNVLTMIDLAGLPLHAAERREDDPLVIGGGPCALHPEPVAPFFDGFVLGDGEAPVAALLEELAAMKAASVPRTARLEALARRFSWFYAPGLYRPRYGAGGAYEGLEPLVPGLPERCRQHFELDFERAYFPTRPIVPHPEVVQDRITLEVMRGCTWNCRYCQAGITKRPVRVRSVETLVRQAEASYAATGYDEISLNSLSTVDYPFLPELVDRLQERFSARRVNVALPSLRIQAGLGGLPAKLTAVRKSGLTMAVEAGSERLRGVISKAISNADYFAALDTAYAHGWNLVKLYFMIGLPGETPDDYQETLDLIHETSDRRRRMGKRPARVNITVSTFVPKPFTPFQWQPFQRLEQTRAVQELLRAGLRHRGLRLKPHLAEGGWIEALLARGDRRLAPVIERAWRLGARFDAWDQRFRFDRWQQALADGGIDAEREVHREREEREALPWDHIDVGVEKAWLAREAAFAREARYTDNCYLKTCHLCGIDPRTCRALQKPVRRELRAACAPTPALTG